MAIERLCKDCGIKIKVWTTTQNRCFECTRKTAKPIQKRGKKTELYEKWRDLIAIPYLDNRYGRACAHCKVMPRAGGRHDVAHIKGRGAHAGLKMVVHNVRYLCRGCHRKETDGKLK